MCMCESKENEKASKKIEINSIDLVMSMCLNQIMGFIWFFKIHTLF